MPLSLHLPDREFHRESRAVLALTRNDSTETDNSPLAGREVATDVAVMVFAVRRRHQHADVAAADFLGGETEHALGRRAEGLDDAALVNDDHAVGDSVEDRAQMRLCFGQSRLGELFLGNVAGDLGGADDASRLIADWRHGQRDLKNPPVLPPTLRLIVLDALALFDAAENFRHLVGAAGGRQQRNRLPLHLLGAVAENAFGGLVPTGDATLESLRDDRVFGRFDDRSQQSALPVHRRYCRRHRSCAPRHLSVPNFRRF